MACMMTSMIRLVLPLVLEAYHGQTHVYQSPERRLDRDDPARPLTTRR